MERLSVSEAAKVLGITPDAVRKRIHRGDIEYTMDENGRYFVYLDPSDTEQDSYRDSYREHSRDELVSELKDRIRFLENELSRERAAHGESRQIMAALTQRIPQLPAPQDTPSEARESPQNASEPRGDAQAPQQTPEEPERLSWWQRWFGT